jgi:hypothetical protein
MEDMKKFEEKAIKRYYGESGIIDLLIGIVSLLVSLGVYYDITFMGVIFILVIMGLSRHLRKTVIIPRLGYAEFTLLNSQKVKRSLRIIVLAIILFVLAVTRIAHFLLSSRYDPLVLVPQTRIFIMMAILLFVIGLAVSRIIILKLYHLFIYCTLFLIIGIIGIVMQIPHTLFWGGLVISFLGIALGLPKILSFLKRYPIIEDKDE